MTAKTARNAATAKTRDTAPPVAAPPPPLPLSPYVQACDLVRIYDDAHVVATAVAAEYAAVGRYWDAVAADPDARYRAVYADDVRLVAHGRAARAYAMVRYWHAVAEAIPDVNPAERLPAPSARYLHNMWPDALR